MIHRSNQKYYIKRNALEKNLVFKNSKCYRGLKIVLEEEKYVKQIP